MVRGCLLVIAFLIAGPPVAEAACTRLPLSDIAFGKAATIAQASGKLDEYAARVARQRGWKGRLRRSNLTSQCSIWLDFGPFGTEYKCLVTATYCTTK